MSIKTQCPGCSQTLKVKETLAGKMIRCPSCQAAFKVIAAESPPQQQTAAVTAAPQTPEFARSLIGRFQIRSALGQGGFGTVYRAFDPILNREVALKIPRRSNQGGERLILEARAAAPLRHPNIVAVFEAGADGDDLFIATEYVVGQTLVDRISGKSIDSSLSAEWVKSLAEALDYAHGEGVVHRDVKPHNIMIGSADRAQLMDFGLAVSRSEELESTDTADSGIAGTPAYMAPEQARGDSQQTGPASDQYSLGAVLYELLTGKPPFRGGPEIVSRIAADAKPTAPRTMVASIPRDVEAICLKAMAPQASRRYASCRAFSEDLGRFLNGELVRARWYSPLELAVYWAKKRPALFGWTAAVVCLLALLIGGGLAMGVRNLMADEESAGVIAETSEKPDSKSNTSTTMDMDVIADLDAETLLYGRQLDRTRFAFEQDDVIQADRWLEQSRWDFRNWEYNYLRRIVNGGWKTLHGHWSEITAIAIHPAGQQFASAGYDSNVRIWNIASGEPVQVLSCNRLVTSLAYSPDGSLLAVSTGDSIDRPTRNEYGISQTSMMGSVMMAPPAPGGNAPAPAPVLAAPPTSVDAAPPAPVVAPAPAVAMPVLAQPGANEHAVILLDSQTLQQVALYSEHSGPIASIAFSPDGQLIASGGTDLNPAGPGGAPVTGSVRIWNVKSQKTERELASPSGPIRRLAFVPGSQRLVATTGQRNYGAVLVWNLDPNAPSSNGPMQSMPPAPAPIESPSAPGAAPAGAPAARAVPVPAALGSTVLAVFPQPPAPVVDSPQPPAPEPIAVSPQPLPSQPAPIVADSPQPPTPQPPSPGILVSPESLALQPEQQYPLGSFALAVSPANGGEIVAAPAMDLWLLEQARRRISGARGVAQDWKITGGPEPLEVRGVPAAVFDAAFAGEPNSFGEHALAFAGGDPLQIRRPGLLTLHHPTYEYGANIKHRGHRSALTAVAFRADGKQFITGDAGGILKVWSAEVHPEVIRLQSQPVATRVAFGMDGRYVAVAGRSQSWTEARGAVSMWDDQGRPIKPEVSPPGSIHLHDIRNGKSLLTLTGGPGDILGLAMDPQSKWIAGGGEDACVRVWDLDSGDLRYEHQTPGVVRCIAVSSDGQMIAASCEAENIGIRPVPAANPEAANIPAGSQGFVVVWQVEDGKELARWPAHDGDAFSVAFSPDGLQLGSSGSDRTVKLWTLADQKLVFTAEAFDGEIVDLAFRPSGLDLAGAGFDSCRPDKSGEVVVWNVTNGQRRLTLPGMPGRMYGVAYSPDGNRLATGGGSFQGSLSTPGEVKVWDAETGIELLPLIGRPGRSEKKEQHCVPYCVPVTTMKYEQRTRTEEVQVPVQKTQTVKVGENKIVDGKEVTIYRDQIETKTEMRTETRDVSYTVCLPVTASETRTRMHSMDVTWEEPGTVLGIAFSGDGRCLAAACEDGSALVWDAANCQPHDSLTWADGRMLSTAASPDGRLIATGGDMGSGCECAGLIRIYDAITGRLTREIETGSGPVTAMSFMPDSQNVVSVGSCNGWQLGPSCSNLDDHVPMSQELANQFSAKRNTIDVRSHCEIWNVAKGTRVIEIGEPEVYIAQIAVDPIDGRVLIAAEKSIRLHDSASGRELRRWTMNSYAESLAVAKDGKRFAVFNNDGTVLMGNLDSDEQPTLLAESLSHSHLTFDADANQLAAVETIWSVGVGHGMAMPVSQERPAPDPAGRSARVQVIAPAPGLKSGLVSRRRLHLWSAESPNEHRVVPLTATHTPSGIAWDSELKSFVIGGEDGSVVLVDPKDGSQTMRMTGHRDATRVLTLPDGRFASFGSENKLKVWRIAPEENRIPDCLECTTPGNRTLTLQTDPQSTIIKVQFSGDGKLAAVSGNRPVQNPMSHWLHPVRMIDATSGNEGFVGGHQDTVRCVAVRPDGQQLATVSQDMQLSVWYPRGHSNHAMNSRPHSNKLMQVVYSRDGSMIATSTAFDGLVWLWNADTLEEIRRFQVEPMTAFALAFDHSGEQLVTAGLSGMIRVWNVQSGELVREWSGHEGKIETVVFSSDGTTLASCGDDKTAKLWRFETGELIRSIDGFQSAVWDIAFSPDDSLLAVGALEPNVRIFKIESGELVKELPEHGTGVWSLAFSPDGSQLACCGRETPLVVWSWEDGTKTASNPQAGECLAWWPDGSKLVTGSVINPPPREQKWEAVFSLHDPASGIVVDTIVLPDVTPRDFSLNHDGRYLAVYRPDGKALIWDRDQDRVVANFRGHQGTVFDICFHPDGQRVATAGQDGSVRIWSLEGKELSAIPQAGHTSCLSFSPDGELLATGNGRTVTLWNVERREAVHTLPGHYGNLCDLSFSGDGSMLATSSCTYVDDGWLGDLKVWETATGKRTLSIPAHTWSNVGVAFHPTLPHVAITGKDHTLMMFHAQTGRLLLSIPTGGYECGSVAFSPDGRRLLAPLANQAKLIDPTPDVAAFGNAPPRRPTQDSAEQAAARWILEQGGQVQVVVDQVIPVDVSQIADLPSDAYTVRRVSLAGIDSISDSDLTVLHPLRHLNSIRLDLKNLTNSGFRFLADNSELQEVFVNGTQLTDKGLESFTGLRQLRVLHMNDTKVTGVGVMLSLSSCTTLENLEMHRTSVDDESLLSVIRLKGLTNLGLSGTKITPEGIAEAKKVKPDLHIGL